MYILFSYSFLRDLVLSSLGIRFYIAVSPRLGLYYQSIYCISQYLIFPVVVQKQSSCQKWHTGIVLVWPSSYFSPVPIQILNLIDNLRYWLHIPGHSVRFDYLFYIIRESSAETNVFCGHTVWFSDDLGVFCLFCCGDLDINCTGTLLPGCFTRPVIEGKNGVGWELTQISSNNGLLKV